MSKNKILIEINKEEEIKGFKKMIISLFFWSPLIMSFLTVSQSGELLINGLHLFAYIYCAFAFFLVLIQIAIILAFKWGAEL